jgi:hypothetical protein
VDSKQQLIYFYLPNPEQVALLAHADPDRDWQLFSTGVQVWIGQTYLRLRQRGMPVQLTSEAPQRGIVVTHADYVPALLEGQAWPGGLIVVSARADRPRQPYAEFEIVQNAHGDGNGVHYVHHWPQPGLIPRDPARGDHIRTIGYKGMMGEMGESFKSRVWLDFIGAMGLSWICDATVWQGNEQAAYRDVAWNDYSGIDLIVAIRKDTSSLYPHKPASKLINAWAAGVPAVLGPEQAYRELRRSELDYIEATTAEEVAEAVRQLHADPQRYRAMVENGLRRSAEFTADRCGARWQQILEHEVPAGSAGLVPLARRLATLVVRYRLSKLRHRLGALRVRST